MLLDPNRLGFTSVLEKHWRTLRREAIALRREEFAVWPVKGAFVGADWSVFPFAMWDHPPELQIDSDANRRRCPESWRIFASLPHLRTVAFSRMEPGCHILPHTDQKIPRVIRSHLGLVVPEGALLRVEGVTHTWADGKVLVFDGQRPHETANLSAEPRLVLLADFELDGAEADYAGIEP